MARTQFEKLQIEAYDDPKYNGKPIQEFYCQINPQNYKEVFASTVENDNVLANGDIPAPVNNAEEGRKLSLEFYLDGTGVVPVTEPKAKVDDVSKTVEDLKTLCLKTNGNIHKPNYLKVRWGKYFYFECILDTISFSYEMFKADGTPLRVKVNADFEGYVDPETKAMRANTNSPDLTHVKTVVLGDDLPKLCSAVYGDPRYYVQVARVNGLRSVRDLSPGMQLVFPPFNK